MSNFTNVETCVKISSSLENVPFDLMDGNQPILDCYESIKWFPSFERAQEAIDQYEASTLTKFILRWKASYDLLKARVRWDTTTQVPYMIIRTIKLECQHAKDRNKLKNDRYKQLTALQRAEENMKKKTYMRTQGSKKANCTATIGISEIVKFPQYKKEEGVAMSTYDQRKNIKSLKLALAIGDESLIGEKACYVAFPSISDHSGHAVGEAAGSLQPLDPRVITKIGELVAAGLTSKKEIKSHLQIYVEQELFKDQKPPSLANRRFFPTIKDIRNHFTSFKKRKLEGSPRKKPAASQPLDEVNIDPSANSISRIANLMNEIQAVSFDATSQDALLQTESDLNATLQNLLNSCGRRRSEVIPSAKPKPRKSKKKRTATEDYDDAVPHKLAKCGSSPHGSRPVITINVECDAEDYA